MRRSDLAGRRGAARPGAEARAALALGAAVLAALAGPSPAAAYCRTSVCPGVGTASVCAPAQANDCGIALFWRSPCVGYSIQDAASRQVSLADTEGLFAQAFDAWMQADCGEGRTPRLRVSYMGPVECGAHEYNQKKGNANIFAFRDDEWPYPGSSNTLALTTVTYNLDTGEIYDADMEINSADVQFSFGDTGATFDLLSIVTHEAGHFLGLSHSADRDATMFSDYRPGSLSLRDLTPDDSAGICAIYPPGEPLKTCDPTVRHGFSPLCADDQPLEEDVELSGGCACALSAPSGERGASLSLAALAAVVLRRRARPRRDGRETAP
jgi:Matrixin